MKGGTQANLIATSAFLRPNVKDNKGCGGIDGETTRVVSLLY